MKLVYRRFVVDGIGLLEAYFCLNQFIVGLSVLKPVYWLFIVVGTSLLEFILWFNAKSSQVDSVKLIFRFIIIEFDPWGSIYITTVQLIPIKILKISIQAIFMRGCLRVVFGENCPEVEKLSKTSLILQNIGTSICVLQDLWVNCTSFTKLGVTETGHDGKTLITFVKGIHFFQVRVQAVRPIWHFF